MKISEKEFKKIIQKEAQKLLKISILKEQRDEIEKELQKIEESDKGWPEKLKKGRFNSYCKQQGFSGPGIECAKQAMKSDDSSVRGMASFYLNTVKPE